MAKHEKHDISFAFGLVLLALGVAAFCMMFLDCFSVLGDTVTYKGSQVAFGYSKTAGFIEVEVFEFNFWVVLAFCLPLVGAVLGFIDNFITKILGACAFGGALLLFFFITTYFGACSPLYENIDAASVTLKLPISIASCCCASGVTVNVLRILAND